MPVQISNQVTDFRSTLLIAREKMEAEYDKGIIAFSSGAIVLSMHFAKGVSELGTLHSRGWVLAAWMCWAASIALMLASFRTSILAMDGTVKRCDETAAGDRIKVSPFNSVTHVLNAASGLAFVGGIVAMAVFALRNLN